VACTLNPVRDAERGGLGMGPVLLLKAATRQRWIDLIAISGLFSSGYEMDADAGTAQTLAKPFKRGDLLRAADLLELPPE
jgi:hypothetical protein